MLTWIKTLNQWRESRKLKINVSLTFLFLRDGTFYFIALSACNVASICTSAPAELVQAVLAILPSLLIQRFLLNLRQFAQGAGVANTTPDIDHFSRFSAPHFRAQSAHSFLGNIGEPLEHAGDEQTPEGCIEAMNAAVSCPEGAASDIEGSDAALRVSDAPHAGRTGQTALRSLSSIDAVEMSHIEEVEV
ncbi:hypothetical protein PsYK624_026290 [Phanerochaete sordida]|uniref:Uncharacterized protein n=1 Tax=Phanerochaete sordida TaxID=48140 RepID=A0A9P3G285_9APHY|nr:hypothetical protein PsYK624_026290 [Phanerochaete sordida]